MSLRVLIQRGSGGNGTHECELPPTKPPTLPETDHSAASGGNKRIAIHVTDGRCKRYWESKTSMGCAS